MQLTKFFIFCLVAAHFTSGEWNEVEDAEVENAIPQFQVEKVANLRDHVDQAVSRSTNMGRCALTKMLSVLGSEIEFKCSANVLPGDTGILLVNGVVAQVISNGESRFSLGVENDVMGHKNYTFVALDDIGDAFAFGTMIQEPPSTEEDQNSNGSDNNNQSSKSGGCSLGRVVVGLSKNESLRIEQTCDLFSPPQFDVSAVIVESDRVVTHRFHYIHFLGRGDATGDMGEDSPDWRGLVPFEIVQFFQTLITREQKKIDQEEQQEKEKEKEESNGRKEDPINVHSPSSHLRRHSSRRRPVIVDVGANKGSHSCYPAALGATVFAVEPYQIHAKRLAMMQQINGWDLHVFCGGADESDGGRDIHNTGSNFEMRNVLAEPGKEIIASWRVPVTRLDSFVTSKERKISMIKIDTDGHEMFVLRGAVGLFKNPGVKYMKIEFIPYSLKTAHPDEPDVALNLLRFLRQHGFAIYNVPVGSHFSVMEWFCHEQLEELKSGEEEGLLGALISHMTPSYPWAMTTLLAVNLTDVNDLALDFPCPLFS